MIRAHVDQVKNIRNVVDAKIDGCKPIKNGHRATAFDYGKVYMEGIAV